LFQFAGLGRFAIPVLRANRKVAALRSARNTLDLKGGKQVRLGAALYFALLVRWILRYFF